MPQPPTASSFPQQDLLTDEDLPPLKSQPLIASASENGKQTSPEPTENQSTIITLPDGSTLDTTGRSAAGVPPIQDFGKKIEKSKREYLAKYGNKLPPVH